MLLRPQRPLQVPAPAAVPGAVPSAGPAAPPAARPWPPDGREGSGSPRKFQVRKQGHTFLEEGQGPSAREPHWCERSSRVRAGKCRAGGEGRPGARARPRAVPGSPEGAVRGRRAGAGGVTRGRVALRDRGSRPGPAVSSDASEISLRVCFFEASPEPDSGPSLSACCRLNAMVYSPNSLVIPFPDHRAHLLLPMILVERGH
nr:uncharacterized protein LOC112425398 [Macaca nemestrina]